MSDILLEIIHQPKRLIGYRAVCRQVFELYDDPYGNTSGAAKIVATMEPGSTREGYTNACHLAEVLASTMNQRMAIA